MPVIPGDNDQEIKEKLAQGKVEAEALKKEKKSEGGVATLEDHLANPGPVIAENLGEPASKEELKKRMEELNQKK
ncbi:hypothetical protein SMMN14_01327 [Sphaerulina musiva]